MRRLDEGVTVSVSATIFVRPLHMYIEDVRRDFAIKHPEIPADVRSEFVDANARRVELHRSMGLNPQQSADEIAMFIPAIGCRSIGDEVRELRGLWRG